MESNKSNYTSAFIFLTSLFFLWGFITVFVDPLIPRLKEVFEINNFQAGMLQFAFFGAYFLLSIPAGFILSKIGYKRGIVLGLFTMAAGCLLFYPAASYRTFGIFLSAVFVLAGGMTILQVAANPYVAALGPEESASSRLNLAQAFNSLGTAIAPILGAMFILSSTVKTSDQIGALSVADRESYYISEAAAVQGPFVTIACILALIALVFLFVKLPQILEKQATGGYGAALKNKWLIMGAIGIFVYVGAEVAIGTWLTSYFVDMNLAEAVKNNDFMSGIASWFLGSDYGTLDPKAIVGAFVTFYWTGAMVGRFIGAYLTKLISPGKVLGFFAIGAMSLIIISMSTTGFVSMWSILAVGLFNSIMFPTIFTLAIDGMGELRPQASGILCTAIVGGAFIPPLFGKLTDSFGFKMAFILTLFCYGYIMFFGLSKSNSKPLASA